MKHSLSLSFLVAIVALTAACERPPIVTTQNGYRGTAMVDVQNPRIDPAPRAIDAVPEPQAPVSSDGPKVSAIYQNVQVLGDLSIGEFTRLMTALTQWVAPTEGCGYCHVGGNFAAEGIYTKVVSRRMIQMTRDINANWTDHVGMTGVTCYTCHRGQNVPANIWFTADNADRGPIGARAGQNRPAPSVAYASLPEDPFTSLLLEGGEIRVASSTALPTGKMTASTQQTEYTYGLMMHMSQSLGVNCTYCHNSRAFASWSESQPTRVKAWYGLRMVNNINTQYMLPLTSEFPDNRLGPLGDVPKANCATCHAGAAKPLGGVSMLTDYPNLKAAAAEFDHSQMLAHAHGSFDNKGEE
jgi:photosynthetic reaction center cytochrome c subunit